MKHTPGPWNFDQDGFVTKSSGSFSGADFDIAIVYTPKDGELVANGRLIAAAPELLAALEEARNGLIWYQETCPKHVSEEDHEAMTRIDAAIAKATGE